MLLLHANRSLILIKIVRIRELGLDVDPKGWK